MGQAGILTHSHTAHLLVESRKAQLAQWTANASHAVASRGEVFAFTDAVLGEVGAVVPLPWIVKPGDPATGSSGRHGGRQYTHGGYCYSEQQSR